MLRRTLLIALFIVLAGALLAGTSSLKRSDSPNLPIGGMDSGMPQYDLGDGLYYTPDTPDLP
jgi:hypothetical protein